MTDNKRLLELALKGLEAERQRIDDEMSEIHRQLGGRPTTASTATVETPRSASAGRGQAGGNLTPAGRRKLSELMRRRWAAKRRATGGGSSAGQQSAQARKSQATRGNLTDEGRKKLSDLMKRRWAAKRRAGSKGGR
jgi:hypothetical protein